MSIKDYEYYYKRMQELYPDVFYKEIIEVEVEVEPEREEEEIYTVQEVCEILGRKKATIYDYIHKGKLKAKRHGGIWLIPQSAINEFQNKPVRRGKGKAVSKELRKMILERDKHQCVCCGNTEDLQIHHKQYRSKGGTDDPDNLVTLCAVCHAKQHEGEPIHRLMVSRMN